MKEIQDIAENSAINFWARHFRRSSIQLNRCHESDAELIPLPGSSELCLAVTTDTIAEEIALGIYRDPYTMGWVTITASLSDLAAVGADPLGMLIAVSLPPALDEAYADKIARGMEDACRHHATFILGGDTNDSSVISLTGCALGTILESSLISRRGCQPGDHVFMTGPAGIGNALGLARLMDCPESLFPEDLYRPTAALRQGRIIRDFASCCMDTSDGVFTTLDQLMRLNQVGFEVRCHWDRLLHPSVLELCRKTAVPEWMMLAGPHGEFQLLFTVPPERTEALWTAFRTDELPLVDLGKVCADCELSLLSPDGNHTIINMAPLRNLFHSVNGDLKQYLHRFREIGQQWEVPSHV